MIRVGLSQIVSSMRHRKAAYSSLVLEVALGCTVVAYSLGVGSALRELTASPLGLDLERTFIVRFEAPLESPHQPRAQRELERVRQLPGVEAAAWIELPPMSRCELPESVMTEAGPKLIWSLRGDAELARVLGLHLGEGRWLRSADAQRGDGGPTAVLVTRAFARELGPHPIGARLSSPGLGSLSVAGVVEDPLRLSPFIAPASSIVITPALPVQARRTSYVARVSTAASAGFAGVAEQELGRAQPVTGCEVERLNDTIILITVLGMVLVVLVGSIGMASSLIVERTRQIGIRRALGARRADIVGYFMLENLLATLLGLLIGCGICVLLDEALTSVRGPVHVAWREFLPHAAAMFLITGQISVWLPARRAACGAPCIMARAM
jgi:putative ABC transport system permease protein